MADITHSLMIKYGLARGPSQTLSDQWVQLAEAFVRQGYSAEEAGERAAKQLFPDYNTHVYASQADTITSLLGKAKDKD